MKNKCEFNFFKPTPDTTANCALSRWNDSSTNLSDFMKNYMNGQQFIQFGFSRNLNVNELLNLSKDAVKNDNDKYDYTINYKKYGDINAYICGFEIPVITKEIPFVFYKQIKSTNQNDESEEKEITNNYVSHVFNHESDLDTNGRIQATKNALSSLRAAVSEMTSQEIQCNFGENETKQSVLQSIDDAYTRVENIESSSDQNEKIFYFGSKNYDDLKEVIENNNISFIPPSPPQSQISTEMTEQDERSLCNSFKELCDPDLYADLCRYSKYGSGIYSNIADQPFDDYYSTGFFLKSAQNKIEQIQQKFFHPNGIELEFEKYDTENVIESSFINNTFCSPLVANKLENSSHLILFFEFNLVETNTIIPFVSHDGTKVPLSQQNITINVNYYNTGNNTSSSYWDTESESPFYIKDGQKVLLELDTNNDFMGGQDYTFWSSPVKKTYNGYKFICAIPLAFYNPETESYCNEYYSTTGKFLYRVPIVKRMRQNIESAIVDTHLTKCLKDIESYDENTSDDENTVVVGNVSLDDSNKNIYYADSKDIATTDEYGEVKIERIKNSHGEDNGLLELMYEYSGSGNTTKAISATEIINIPMAGRAMDLITLFDVLKDLNNGSPVTNHSFVLNNEKKQQNITINTDSINITGSLTLDPARSIDGVSFDGNRDIIHYCICNTAADITIKEVTCDGFVLKHGAILHVYFEYGNTVGSWGNVLIPKLKVNNNDEKKFFYITSGVIIPNQEAYTSSYIRPGEIVELIYDSTSDMFIRNRTWCAYMSNGLACIGYTNNSHSQTERIVLATAKYDSVDNNTMIIPETDNKTDLGSSNLNWKNIYSKSNIINGSSFNGVFSQTQFDENNFKEGIYVVKNVSCKGELTNSGDINNYSGFDYSVKRFILYNDDNSVVGKQFIILRHKDTHYYILYRNEGNLGGSFQKTIYGSILDSYGRISDVIMSKHSLGEKYCLITTKIYNDGSMDYYGTVYNVRYDDNTVDSSINLVLYNNGDSITRSTNDLQLFNLINDKLCIFDRTDRKLYITDLININGNYSSFYVTILEELQFLPQNTTQYGVTLSRIVMNVEQITEKIMVITVGTDTPPYKAGIVLTENAGTWTPSHILPDYILDPVTNQTPSWLNLSAWKHDICKYLKVVVTNATVNYYSSYYLNMKNGTYDIKDQFFIKDINEECYGDLLSYCDPIT